MLKLSKSKKGQFFVISAVIMISLVTLANQYLSDFGKTRLTKIEEVQELQYLSQIKKDLSTAVDSSTCARFDVDLNDTENFLKGQLAKKGIEFAVKHSISCPKVNFKFNLTTPTFSSQTEFTYP